MHKVRGCSLTSLNITATIVLPWSQRTQQSLSSEIWFLSWRSWCTSVNTRILSTFLVLAQKVLHSYILIELSVNISLYRAQFHSLNKVSLSAFIVSSYFLLRTRVWSSGHHWILPSWEFAWVSTKKTWFIRSRMGTCHRESRRTILYYWFSHNCIPSE